ncbi:MAG: prealbumin-like fold domain-containing protein [Clostridium sp.]|uniref:prealbumin-like fold domain-containing protein n=1 Tax=Clostridium sp. TaxID=1506 RepID=UPI003F2EB713
MNNEVWALKNNLGKIIVNVFLEEDITESMGDAKVNLYRINGISPQLEVSKITGPDGVVIFENLVPGNYRVIQIIDKEMYEKPVYKPWNEVNISNYNKESIVNIRNKKKRED